MTKFDDFFGKPAEPVHHQLKDWDARRGVPGTTITFEVFRPKLDFGQSWPEMYIQVTNPDGTLQPLDTLSWDDELNTGLVRRGVKAVDTENEVERFSLGLRAAMRRPTREFGDGFFNAVVLEYVVENRDLAADPLIAELLKHCYAPRPRKDGASVRGYNTCREMITDAIGGRAAELIGPLGYTRAEAETILVRAIAEYLDDRFSVSAQRRMGFL